MNYSKQYSNVNRSVTQSCDVVKHMLFLYFVRGIKYMQNVSKFNSHYKKGPLTGIRLIECYLCSMRQNNCCERTLNNMQIQILENSTC